MYSGVATDDAMNLAMSAKAVPLYEAVKKFIAEEIEPVTRTYFELGEGRAERWSYGEGQLELLEQLKNKAKALKVLRSRLLERAQAEQQSAIAASRRTMVGSGDRSERIRTYNFPQNRVTDHRINLTVHALDRVLDGDLEPIIGPLVAHQQAAALEASG